MKQRDIWTSLETLIHDADYAACATLIGELEKMKALARQIRRDMPVTEPGKRHA